MAPPSPTTLADVLSAFSSFLTISIHSILYHRSLYPRTTFLTARAYNYPVHQSRHPLVCQWINDAISAVEEQLLKGLQSTALDLKYARNERVERVVLVVYGPVPEKLHSTTNSGGDGGGDSFTSLESSKSNTSSNEERTRDRPLERYIFDTSRFPIVPKGEAHTPVEAFVKMQVDLEEQFRGSLARLEQRCQKLSVLPKGCTYTLAMELADEGAAPVGHPQAWVPVQPGMQRVKGGEAGEEGKGGRSVPVGSVRADQFMFEMWIEEGKAKVEMARRGMRATVEDG
ncbi:hypothetical protein LTS18_011078 [Coniosporium uncinatum]|uniref:Uncharacterized protein n=1 Tax=Coniosporium uncinatum TaxID=93489 RepID=A0ACC3CYU9_9PEZI|nr:hypothetical protein LTS18_011078 [Coniosporium uncinatum]